MGKKFSHFFLENGIEVVVYPIKGIRSVSICLGLAAGSSIEKENEVGTLHFLEHVILQGTQRYPTGKQVARAAEELGVSYNGWVGATDSHFLFFTPDDRLKEVFEFASDLLLHPLFSQEAVEKERNVILTEQKSYWDNPAHRFSHQALTKIIGKKHPYARQGFGEMEVVEKMTREKLLLSYNRYYLPQNFKLSVAGNVSIGSLKILLKKYFGQGKKTETKIQFPRPGAVSFKPSYFVFSKPRKEVVFDFSFPMLGFKEYSLEERLTSGVLGFLMGGGRTSLLFQRLREELGLVYSVGSGRRFWPYLGMFGIEGEVDGKNLRQVIDETWKIIRKVKREGFGRENFKRAVAYMNTRTLLEFSEPRVISGYFLNLLIDGRELLGFEEIIEAANKITLPEVNQMTKQVLDFGKMNLALKGDKKIIEKSGVQRDFDSLTTRE